MLHVHVVKMANNMQWKQVTPVMNIFETALHILVHV